MARLNRLDVRDNRTLFAMWPNISLVEIGADEAKGRSDHFEALRQLILANEAMYPEIDHWFEEKVIPGLVSRERAAYVAYEEDRPIASAVLKLGDRSKFCHLKIHRDFQDIDLGQAFFTLMTLRIRDRASEVHFSLPEGLWHARKPFFTSFGFSEASRAHHQYRTGEEELYCSAPLERVRAAALEKLPLLIHKFSVDGQGIGSQLLISLKPKHAREIMEGRKTVEVRRRFSPKWTGCQAAIYSTEPEGALLGEAVIRSVTKGTPADLWQQFGAQIGCSWEVYHRYTMNADTVYAIELDEIRSFFSPIPKEQMEYLLSAELRAPQSYLDLSDSGTHKWALAVSVAALLHAYRPNQTARMK